MSTLEVIEPATEQILAEVPRAGVDETDAAVARAHSAFPAWRAVAPGDRCRLLHRLSHVLSEHHEELAVLEARDAGKPIGDARGEMGMVIDTFAYYAGAPERLLGDTIPVAGGLGFTVREPLGVVALITPWNFPLTIAAWKLAPALAAGNTVVLKPAELTPMTSLRFAELALEAGIPEGVINVVAGPGSHRGRPPRRAPARRQGGVHRVDRGRTLHRRDRRADDQARHARAGRQERERRLRRRRSGAGRGGRPGRRLRQRRAGLLRALPDPRGVLGARPVHGRARGVGRRRSSWAIPLDEATTMGPLISADHRDKVASFVDDDAPVAIRGAAPDGPGYWFPPTVLCPVDPSARAATEEIFGPVACVIPFRDEAHAIALANDTIYGLSGSVWTRNGAKALRVARAIDSGVLSINSNSSVRVSTPFGGFKQSGIGRELGPHALDHYTELKTIYYATQES